MIYAIARLLHFKYSLFAVLLGKPQYDVIRLTWGKVRDTTNREDRKNPTEHSKDLLQTEAVRNFHSLLTIDTTYTLPL